MVVPSQPSILAFSQRQVGRLTGLAERQLRYWDDTGLVSPQYATENRRRPYSRVYSYRDVVGLSALALLLYVACFAAAGRARPPDSPGCRACARSAAGVGRQRRRAAVLG